MTQMHAGLICTLLLIGTMAGMFGCMSAARCRRYFAFALCLGLTALDAALLVVPLSSPPGALSPAPWTASALLLVALGIWISRKLFLASRRQISPVSIKESSDHLPCALCFAWENGQPCLKNYIMDELSHLLTGEALLNANAFWETIAHEPIVTLSNGQTCSFERTRMALSGQSVYQIDVYKRQGLYPTEADMSALQEFFPEVNLRKLYEVEKYHKKLAGIMNEQFAAERTALEQELESLRLQHQGIRDQIRELGFVGNISKEFLDRHSELKAEIAALTTQNQAFLMQRDLQDAKAKAEETLRRSIETILAEIEEILNAKMKEFNDMLFRTHRKPPKIKFNRYDSYKFETPDDTGTGSNYKGMIVYDLAVLFTTALPALAHDSLIFKNLEKDVEDGIMKIYASTSKQVFIAYDKQGDCRLETQKLLEDNCVLRLSDNNCELYGRAWNKEE